MKTAEQMREEAAQVAEDLEIRWRKRAAEQQGLYDRAWIGATENRKNAETIKAAADGLAAVAKCIRKLPLNDHGQARDKEG